MNKKIQVAWGKWSDQQFDNGNFTPSRSIPISHHLQKETKELTKALENYFINPSIKTKHNLIEEFVDCRALLADVQRLAGLLDWEIDQGALVKLDENKKREWGKPDKNGVVEHIEK